MNSKLKKFLKIIILFMIIYLFISAIYILLHINFGNKPEIVGMGFSKSNNILRVFMGLPKTYSTYEGVSPIYLISVAIRIILAVILFKLFKKNFIMLHMDIQHQK
jgi:hypothetical protein